MKMNRLVSAILMGTSFVSINVHAGFDWGGKSGECAGDGTFQQPIAKDAVVEVGEIPAGKEGVYIELKSYKDIDIQLYDKATGHPIVKWPDGDLNKNYKQSTTYAGSRIEWSGYNGDCQFFNDSYSVCEAGTSPGNEYIKIDLTQTPLTMKAFGYDSGEARVNYSWEGSVGCDSNGPALSGSGSFHQQITESDVIEVGKLIPGLKDVYIELRSDNDIDIQLYDGAVKIVHWPDGTLSGPGYQVTNYYGMEIEWSGYNGVDGNLGHEYIKISGEIDRELTMRVYGYNAGNAKVVYAWGGENFTSSINIEDSIVGNRIITGILMNSYGDTLANAHIGVEDSVQRMSSQVKTDAMGKFRYPVYGEPKVNSTLTFHYKGQTIAVVPIYAKKELPPAVQYHDPSTDITIMIENMVLDGFHGTQYPLPHTGDIFNVVKTHECGSVPIGETNITCIPSFNSVEEKHVFASKLAEDISGKIPESVINAAKNVGGVMLVTGIGVGITCVATAGTGCVPAALVGVSIIKAATLSNAVVAGMEETTNTLATTGLISEDGKYFLKTYIKGGQIVLNVISVANAGIAAGDYVHAVHALGENSYFVKNAAGAVAVNSAEAFRVTLETIDKIEEMAKKGEFK